MLKIAICDDDSNFMKYDLSAKINNVLKKSRTEAEVCYFSDGYRLLKKFEDGNGYDIVLLDIKMPKINGKDLAFRLRTLNSAFILVFISQYVDEVLDTLQYRVSAFIPKNSDDLCYERELERIFREYQNMSIEYHAFDTVNEIGMRCTLKVPVNDIFYLSCRNKEIYLHTSREKHRIFVNSFQDLVEKFFVFNFMESHRGYVVNMRHVQKVLSNELLLDNNASLPVSRRKYKKLQQAMNCIITREVFEQ